MADANYENLCTDKEGKPLSRSAFDRVNNFMYPNGYVTGLGTGILYNDPTL